MHTSWSLLYSITKRFEKVEFPFLFIRALTTSLSTCISNILRSTTQPHSSLQRFMLEPLALPQLAVALNRELVIRHLEAPHSIMGNSQTYRARSVAKKASITDHSIHQTRKTFVATASRAERNVLHPYIRSLDPIAIDLGVEWNWHAANVQALM